MSDATKAVFVSYAREDTDAARRIAEALRSHKALDQGSGRYMLAPGLSAHFGDQKSEAQRRC